MYCLYDPHPERDEAHHLKLHSYNYREIGSWDVSVNMGENAGKACWFFIDEEEYFLNDPRPERDEAAPLEVAVLEFQTV